MFIGVTELVLLLCVPFMLRTRRSREHFLALLSSVSNLVKFGVLLLIGLIGILLYVFGPGRGHPIVIAAVLNLDPFWAAVIAYLVAGKKIPTSLLTFTLCLIVSFIGAMLLAVSQTDAQTIWSADVRYWLISGPKTGASRPCPVGAQRHVRRQMVFGLRRLCMHSRDIRDGRRGRHSHYAGDRLSQSGVQLTTDALPALALLAIGTILATGLGRVLYQRALTITDNNNGFVSVFFLLIPAFTCLLSLGMSPWIKELKFPVGPLFFLGLGLVGAPILVFLWQSERKSDPSSSQEQEFDHAVPVSDPV